MHPIMYNIPAFMKTFFITLVNKTVETWNFLRLSAKMHGKFILVNLNKKLWTNLHYVMVWNLFTKRWRKLFGTTYLMKNFIGVQELTVVAALNLKVYFIHFWPKISKFDHESHFWYGSSWYKGNLHFPSHCWEKG